MTCEETLKRAIEKYQTKNIPYGAFYLLPNGEVLDLTSFANGHADFWEYIEFLHPKIGEAKNYLRGLGWIKANAKVGYIEADLVPTAGQLRLIDEILKLYPNIEKETNHERRKK